MSQPIFSSSLCLFFLLPNNFFAFSFRKCACEFPDVWTQPGRTPRPNPRSVGAILILICPLKFFYLWLFAGLSCRQNGAAQDRQVHVPWFGGKFRFLVLSQNFCSCFVRNSFQSLLFLFRQWNQTVWVLRLSLDISQQWNLVTSSAHSSFIGARVMARKKGEVMRLHANRLQNTGTEN